MKSKLGRFSCCGNNKPDKGVSKVKVVGDGEDLLHFSGVEVGCYSGHRKN